MADRKAMHMLAYATGSALLKQPLATVQLAKQVAGLALSTHVIPQIIRQFWHAGVQISPTPSPCCSARRLSFWVSSRSRSTCSSAPAAASWSSGDDARQTAGRATRSEPTHRSSMHTVAIFRVAIIASL